MITTPTQRNAANPFALHNLTHSQFLHLIIRSQKQQAIASVVKEAVGYVEESPEGAVRQNLVVCLRDITDGRIYVEAERARWVGCSLGRRDGVRW